MTKATLYVREDPALLNNEIFSSKPLYGMKSDNYLFVALKQTFESYGISLATQDIHPIGDSSIILSIDQVTFFADYVKKDNQSLYLLLAEPSTYCPDNFIRSNHKVFDKVLTYDYTSVDFEKYFPYVFPIDFNSYPAFKSVSEAEFQQRKFSVMVAAAFWTEAPKGNSGSLLYDRYLTLEWFANHHPQKLDLYSRTIDQRMFENTLGSSPKAALIRRILPINLIKRLIPSTVRKKLNKQGEHHKSVFDKMRRGSIPPNSKIEYISKYRFAFAYENTGDTPGYITEKIFDCFAAGIVPVYMGTPPVELIPKDCFIDRRSFETHEELYNYMNSMDYNTYSTYINNIKIFLTGPENTKFTPDVIAKGISEVLLK